MFKQQNHYRRPCYIVGIAYDNLLWNEDQNNGGLLSDKIYNAWPNHDQSTMVKCSVTSTQEELYSEPAVRLTFSDVQKMPIKGAAITEEHTGKRVGTVKEKWIDDGGRLMVEAHIQDLDTAEKARRGKYTGFSVGYFFDTVGKRVTNKTFDHLAVCEDPVFDRCRFSVTASKTGDSSNDVDSSMVVPTMVKSASSGIRIDSVNDEPFKIQINNSINDKSGRSSLNTPVKGSLLTTRTTMETQTSQSTGAQGFQSMGNFDEQQQQQQSTLDLLERSNTNEPEEEEEEEEKDKDTNKTNSPLKEDDIRRFLLKKEKMRQLKAENRRYQEEKRQQTQKYLEAQGPKKKAFMDFAKNLNNGELPADVEEVIEGSFTTPGYEGWMTVLEKMRAEHVQMAETLKKEREERSNMDRENNELKRKSEKQRNMFKLLKANDGSKKQVSWDKEKEYNDGNRTGLFGKKSTSGVPPANARTPKMESIFRKKEPESSSKMTTGGSGKKSGGFLEESRRMSVTASRGKTSASPSSSTEGFDFREEKGLLNQLDPSLWDDFNRFSTVDPKADAWQYLVKHQTVDSIPVIRYPTGRY